MNFLAKIQDFTLKLTKGTSKYKNKGESLMGTTDKICLKVWQTDSEGWTDKNTRDEDFYIYIPERFISKLPTKIKSILFGINSYDLLSKYTMRFFPLWNNMCKIILEIGHYYHYSKPCQESRFNTTIILNTLLYYLYFFWLLSSQINSFFYCNSRAYLLSNLRKMPCPQ